MNKIYSRHNFHNRTFCVWQEVKLEAIAGLAISYQSPSGSKYIFNDTGVYRISNHWGRAANCRWRLEPLEAYKNQHVKVGFALWTDFYPNDESSKLFYVTANLETNEVSFHHKDAQPYDEKSVLRNAAETAKTIKAVRQVLTETHWANHLQYDQLSTLRKEIVNELITTEKPFILIKQKYHQN
ncbi:hypothetical protein [Flavobacterium sp. XGLA_31]|uniref:hypothetical protein n=1 Tax=Flavobacterium sp. XGLA_31 TaxID=3447666 RepID=UPI003F3DFE04